MYPARTRSNWVFPFTGLPVFRSAAESDKLFCGISGNLHKTKKEKNIKNKSRGPPLNSNKKKSNFRGRLGTQFQAESHPGPCGAAGRKSGRRPSGFLMFLHCDIYGWFSTWSLPSGDLVTCFSSLVRWLPELPDVLALKRTAKGNERDCKLERSSAWKEGLIPTHGPGPSSSVLGPGHRAITGSDIRTSPGRKRAWTRPKGGSGEPERGNDTTSPKP